jgi:hypothetical protein
MEKCWDKGFLFFVMRLKKIICKSNNYKKKYAIPFLLHLWMYKISLWTIFTGRVWRYNRTNFFYIVFFVIHLHYTSFSLRFLVCCFAEKGAGSVYSKSVNLMRCLFKEGTNILLQKVGEGWNRYYKLFSNIFLISFTNTNIFPCCISNREYLMYYRGSGFLAVFCFGSFLPSTASKLSLFLSVSVCRRSSSLIGEGGGGRSQFKRRRVSRVLYNPLKALC